MSTPAAAALTDAGIPPATPPAATPPAANEGFWKDWTAPEQKETRDWIANKKYADPFVLAKTAQGLEKEAASLRTAVSVKAYPEDTRNPDGTFKKADENAVKAWNLAMGVPATAADYKLQPPANTPFPEFTGYLAEVLHQAGTPPAMAKVLADGYEKATARLEAELTAKEETAKQMAVKHLEIEWGSNFKERAALVTRGEKWFAERAGLDEKKTHILMSSLTPAVYMKLMYEFGAGNKEPSFAGGSGGKGFEGGASAAQAEWDQIMADRTAGKISNHVWNNPAEIARRDALVERIANGNAH